MVLSGAFLFHKNFLQFVTKLFYIRLTNTKRMNQRNNLKQKPNRTRLWAVVSIVILFGIVFVFLKKPKQSDDLGTFDDPEIAFIETQKALNLIAKNLNKGKESINYLQEYENTKDRIFKP